VQHLSPGVNFSTLNVLLDVASRKKKKIKNCKSCTCMIYTVDGREYLSDEVRISCLQVIYL